MKSFSIALVAFAAGILLGTAARPSSVHAQPAAARSVYVDELPGQGTSATSLRGSEIVGFSCAVDGTGAIHCYAASMNH